MDYEARRIIEALRSGIPSRVIGVYFGGARTEMLAGISEWLDSGNGGGKIITGNYGEGKTHLLNTVFNMAQKKNMAVSVVSLSKETPLSRLHLIYQKVALNTYLPGREQPGFGHLLDRLEPEDALSLQLYTGKDLQTDKLYYVLKTYAGTDDPEIKFSLQADLQGDFISNAHLKTYYRAIFGGKVIFSSNFNKNRHIDDYFLFLRRLFAASGLNGWIILFDEVELIGRLGRKSRFNAYTNMDKIWQMKDIFSLFAMHESYANEVIDGKNERQYLEEAESFDRKIISHVLDQIESAPELPPLDRTELMEVLSKILDFYVRAYDWRPNINASELYEMAQSHGYLLRTKIRAAIEVLDQHLQYGDAGVIMTGELDNETYQEEIPLPDEL